MAPQPLFHVRRRRGSMPGGGRHCRPPSRDLLKFAREAARRLDLLPLGGIMDGSLLMRAPIGLVLLLAAGIVMVAISYLTQ
jgi:hypothetical protein